MLIDDRRVCPAQGFRRTPLHPLGSLVAFGVIKTRLTEAPADSGATIDLQGRAIKVGVNPDVLRALEQSIPRGRGGTPAEAADAAGLKFARTCGRST